MKRAFEALLCATSMVAMCQVNVALAQDAAGSPAPEEEASAAADPGATASSARGGDIVVTAQRREERLVDVPVSVVALDGEQLAESGVNAIDDLGRSAPGVVVNKLGAYLQPTIRGIGANVQGSGADPNVAIYVDGVYVPSQTGSMFDLANIESVQILKGPQGTLFGRNATGGAILLTTLDPSFDTTAKVTLGYGRFNEVKANTYLSTGLTDTIAADLSVYYRRSDGFMKDILTGADRNEQKSFDVRSKLLFEPSDSARFVLALSHNETSDPTGLTQTTLNGNTLGNRFPDPGPVAVERGDVSQEIPTIIDVNIDQASLTGEFDIGFATLNSISAYRDEDGYIQSDLDSSYVPALYARYDQYINSFSQEINLTGPSGNPLSWVVGAFYYWSEAGSDDFELNGSTFFKARITTDAIAGFADATYDLGGVSLIAGLRYSTEKREFKRSPDGGPYTIDTGERFSDWTPRVGIRVDMGPSSNVYATFSQGFKSGTYNVSSPSTVPVRPENIDAYEVGFKTASYLFDLNAAAYYYKYDDIQVTAYDFTTGLSRVFNAAKAEVYGGELDATWRPVDAFDLRAAVAYTHARYEDFPGATAFTPRPNNDGNDQTIIDASGAEMLRAPEWTLSATANYRIALSGGSELALSLRPYYSSRVNFSFDERIQQPGYFTLDGTVTWNANDNLRVSAYGRNLTDKKYATYRGQTSARDGIVWAQPLSYGLSMSYRY